MPSFLFWIMLSPDSCSGVNKLKLGGNAER
jgi:hypothetical protein